MRAGLLSDTLNLLIEIGFLDLARQGRIIQPLCVRHIQAAVLGLPLVKGRPADPCLRHNIRGVGPGLLLSQNPDNLLFRKPRSLHHPPLRGNGLYSFLEEFAGPKSRRVPYSSQSSWLGIMRRCRPRLAAHGRRARPAANTLTMYFLTSTSRHGIMLVILS